MGNTFIWEAPSMKTLSVLQTKQKSVHMLEFSKDGRLLVSIAEDKSIAVSDWRSQNVIINTKGEGAVTYQIASSSVSANFNFLSCGDKHIKFWNLNGRNLTSTKVTTSGCKGASPQIFWSSCEVKGKFFIGCDDGSIYVSPDSKTVKAILDHHPAEEKPKLGKSGGSITSMFNDDLKNIFITGAKNGSICVWDTSAMSATVDLPVKKYSFILAPAPSAGGATAASPNPGVVFVKDLMAKQIQSVSTLPNNTAVNGVPDSGLLLLVTTRGCDMLEILCTDSGATLLHGNDSVIMRSHCNDELWGVATHPSRPEFCTVGDDKTLRFFNVRSKSMIAVVPLGFIARTCSYDPSGRVLAIGFGGRVGKGKEGGDGVLRLYSCDPNSSTGITKLDERSDAKQWISDLKFSSDGRTLCVGAHDCKIYIYNVTIEGSTATMKLRTTFAKHAAVINHLDLSVDGRFMQSNCSAFELLFSDTTTGKQITSATELKDVKWDSWTCTFGWPVQGIWAAGMDGLDINAVSRSRSVRPFFFLFYSES